MCTDSCDTIVGRKIRQRIFREDGFMSGTLDRELIYEILSVVEEITCDCIDQGRHLWDC